MTNLTPPPMSDAELWKVYNAWRRDHECDTTFDLMKMAIAARDEQWRQRLEAVAEVNSDGASVRLDWASVEAAHNARPGTLYRIKEQG